MIYNRKTKTRNLKITLETSKDFTVFVFNNKLLEISGKVGGFQSLLTRLFSFGDEGAQEGGIDENGDRRSTRRIIYSTGEQNNSTVREQPQQRRAPGQYRPVWEEERDINKRPESYRYND